MTWQYGQPDPNQPQGYPPPGGYPDYGQNPPYGQGTPYDQGQQYGQPPGGYPQAGQYPPPGMYPQYGYPAYPSSGTNGLAIASLVLGIAQIFLWFVAGIPAIILGAVALRQVRLSGQSGRGMAIAGIILGSIGIVLSILLIILIIVAAHQQSNCVQNGTC
jgi:hypothetical protein